MVKNLNLREGHLLEEVAIGGVLRADLLAEHDVDGNLGASGT